MKITAVETLVCHARMRNWVFVKVQTDQPGLYGWGEELESNAISVYMHQLRKKLGADLLHTVRGLGYYAGPEK